MGTFSLSVLVAGLSRPSETMVMYISVVKYSLCSAHRTLHIIIEIVLPQLTWFPKERVSLIGF